MPTLNITDLMALANLPHQGSIEISHPEMSGLETNPKDDWLYLALLALKTIASVRAPAIHSAALIGSGNGIDAIASLKLFPNLETLVVTDLIPELLPGIVNNINSNVPERLQGIRTYCLAGRDCLPIPKPVDLIYANLPLIMFDNQHIDTNLARTTLTDVNQYLPLATDANDILLRYSLLSQLGFLLSAKEKLKPNGRILTLIGGRVPNYALSECFNRAGLIYRTVHITFKRQSDPQFLKEYSQYETQTGISFVFYDYQRVSEIIRDELGINIPNLIPYLGDTELKTLLAPAALTAQQAYQYYLTNKSVGHIAQAFEAWTPTQHTNL